MRKATQILFLICFILSCKVFPQTTGSRNVSVTLPVVTLLDVEPTGSISLNFAAPVDAGRPVINPSANTSKWINYTSAITSGGLTRRVTASINQTIPGIDIKLQTAAASGAGGGALGTPSAQVILSTTPITIISGIGGAFTGNGANNGHRLTITLVPNTYADLSARTNTQVAITYTITE